MLPKSIADMMVRRLRWVTAATIVSTVIVTLAGQATSFWHNPITAMRGDGLSINNPTNHSFEFFIGSGWQPYVVASMAYLLILLLLISSLPRRLALVIAFTAIFCNFYSTSNWLAVHWGLGILGPFLYGLVLAVAIVLLVIDRHSAPGTLHGLRATMLLALFADMAVTVLGQPTGYLHNSQLVHEGNPLSRFFLERGWYSFIAEQIFIAVFFYWLTGSLPRRWGLIITCCYIFAGFTGASNWLFFEWRLGVPAIAGLGFLLSVLVMMSIFFGPKQGFARGPLAFGHQNAGADVGCKI
jgi:hypothetical protein